MSFSQKNDSALGGVTCSVANCIYNSGHMTCHATNGIEINCCDPVQQCSVQCKTFQPKTGR